MRKTLQTTLEKYIMYNELYVRILGTLGSNQEVVRFRWLIKYVSPALVTACSQPSGSVPNCPSAFEDIIGLEAAVAERVTPTYSFYSYFIMSFHVH